MPVRAVAPADPASDGSGERRHDGCPWSAATGVPPRPWAGEDRRLRAECGAWGMQAVATVHPYGYGFERCRGWSSCPRVPGCTGRSVSWLRVGRSVERRSRSIDGVGAACCWWRRDAWGVVLSGDRGPTTWAVERAAGAGATRGALRGVAIVGRRRGRWSVLLGCSRRVGWLLQLRSRWIDCVGGAGRVCACDAGVVCSCRDLGATTWSSPDGGLRDG